MSPQEKAVILKALKAYATMNFMAFNECFESEEEKEIIESLRERLDDTSYESDDIDESMDGDHDSAMESAGWGTDEDYGYYGEDY